MARTHVAWAGGLAGAGPAWLDRAAPVVAMTLATALGAQVAVPLPFTPVPLTMQVLGVLLSGLVLSPRGAFAAQVAYVGAGALGVPWFAGLSALGPGVPLTLGYLLGFVLAAPAVALSRKVLGPVAAAALGVLVIHVAGASWLAALMGLSPLTALWLGSLPFLPGDVLKVGAALAASRLLAPRGTPRG